ncbi:MAG: organic solvent tolerance protein OstA [Treponema sp.]|nr:organic solvent tolerance protein OstA [Treponema sp.]
MKRVFFVLSFAVFFISFAFSEKIIFSADTMTGQTGKNESTTSLVGHAYIKTDSMEITADEIELSGEDYRFIKATGAVSGKNSKSGMDFVCDLLEYDRETTIALLQGNVDLVDAENDVKAQAQIIEYNQDTNIAVMQINVNLTQKNNICKGAYAVYQKESQLLDISGNAEVKQNDDTFRAQQITLNLETEDITLSGNVKGTVTEKNKSE